MRDRAQRRGGATADRGDDVTETEFTPAKKPCRFGDQCQHPDGPMLPLSEFTSNGMGGLRTECKTCFNVNQLKRRIELRNGAPKRVRKPNKQVRSGRLWQAAPKGGDGRPKPYWKWTDEDSRNYDAAREESKHA